MSLMDTLAYLDGEFKSFICKGKRDRKPSIFSDMIYVYLY